jgi:hypothetical protein
MDMKTKGTTIKPCPFCGKPPEWVDTNLSGSRGFLRCENVKCPARVETLAAFRKVVIRKWNTRKN